MSKAFALLAACSFLVLAACGDDETTVAPIASRTVTLQAADFTFTPNQFSATRNETIAVVIQNQGAMPHNIEFEFPAGEVEMGNVGPGGSGSLNVTMPATAGSYTFYCGVGTHRQLGMVGTVVVQ